MNPVLGIKPVKVPPSPTLPFEEEQMAAILAACDRFPSMGIYNHGNRQRMKTLTLLMRYSGCGSATLSRVRVIDLWARSYFFIKPKQARQSIVPFHRSSSRR